MIIPKTEELLQIAKRLLWFCSPEEALEQPTLFIAHVMTYGTIKDILVVEDNLGKEAFEHTLDQAPAGVFDARSWAYWNLICNRRPTPPLPTRNLSG
jgi:hypothetical protein